MYALNTFFRVVRFLSNSFIGLAVGFILGLAVGGGDFSISGFLGSIGL